jgi:integrase
MLGGKTTLLDAVKSYLANHRGDGPPPKPARFDEAAKLYHAFKVAQGKSRSHCKNIHSRLDRLVEELPAGVLLDELTAGQLENAVLDFGLAPKTRNEYRIMLANLYSWGAKQNPPLVPKGFNPAREMERYDVQRNEIEFLHVADLRRILAALPAKRPDLVPLVVLVCFAGLRPSEAVRLDWNEVGEDYIRLPARKSKTGFGRQIPVQPNLKQWLAQWRKGSGLICPKVSLGHINDAIRHACGLRLSHDAMRHGYGTHRQVVLKNIAAVAGEMGNTVGVCRQHYANPFCTEREANEWFAIGPVTVDNILKMQPEIGAPSDGSTTVPASDDGLPGGPASLATS